jgi:hypothetical protein
MAKNQNQPEAPKAEQPKNNLYPFGIATVRKPSFDMSARDGRDGQKSCKMLEIDVPIVSCGVIVTASMYANYDPKRGELVFQGSAPRGVTLPEDADKALFRAHVLAACEAHREWEALQNKAESVLLGTYQRPVTEKPTRLVRTVGGVKQVIAEAPAPAAQNAAAAGQ